MAEPKLINSWEVKPFKMDETYESRMILDDIVAGTKTVQVNEGTLKGGCATGGDIHNGDEIYYIVKGEAELRLGDDIRDVKQGSLAFIPSGVFHSLKNKSAAEDFVLLTLWTDAAYNDTYELRMRVWGKSFKTIHED